MHGHTDAADTDMRTFCATTAGEPPTLSGRGQLPQLSTHDTMQWWRLVHAAVRRGSAARACDTVPRETGSASMAAANGPQAGGTNGSAKFDSPHCIVLTQLVRLGTGEWRRLYEGGYREEGTSRDSGTEFAHERRRPSATAVQSTSPRLCRLSAGHVGRRSRVTGQAAQIRESDPLVGPRTHLTQE